MPSQIAELRTLCPHRPLAPFEAARVAELQANRLLDLQGIAEPPVPEQLIEYLPRIRVVWRDDAGKDANQSTAPRHPKIKRCQHRGWGAMPNKLAVAQHAA